MREKPLIGITIGDYNGIGTEVILKALANNGILQICTPVIYGSMKIISRYRKLLQLPEWFINTAQDIKQITPKKTNIINVTTKVSLEIEPGKITNDAGTFAVECLQTAVKDLLEGHIDGLVTAPINKDNVQSDTFKFVGHTEFLAEACQVKDNLMFMVSESLKIALLTAHIPISQVSNQITREKIFKKLDLLIKSLKNDFAINKPKIAVLGLNPHAGENGLLGSEELQVIAPAVHELKKKGNMIFGPFPADGFFGQHAYRKYDAVLAMYHDQALIPFKTLMMESGVNFTAGLPIVRTSPDHGTAHDIAGKNQADESSLLQSIFMACDIVKNRWSLEKEA
ncbi:MAG: 4-hydroxythreonine-4-phosphate dehydrogenase PdxA [Bacteroidetes bacterium]|nr:MAG: 4-hydroxythreonine-4-phosphate dehydrogenase PdxA [Bacteroidota bacterium]TAG88148.1 MAG: 4-hydroxythreonine-4-phosphate dehydrogenase PdxA [Bacteroidota bacterium]